MKKFLKRLKYFFFFANQQFELLPLVIRCHMMFGKGQADGLTIKSQKYGTVKTVVGEYYTLDELIDMYEAENEEI